ncbi:MAG: hypothetical protein ACYCRF_10730, partial [Acidithiobacillus sp.]
AAQNDNITRTASIFLMVISSWLQIALSQGLPPAGLAACMACRLHGLPPCERAALQAASPASHTGRVHHQKW